MVLKRCVAEYKDCGMFILGCVPTKTFVLSERKFTRIYMVCSTLVGLSDQRPFLGTFILQL